MAYVVRITPRARRDLANLFKEIHAGESETAWTWYQGLKDAALTLERLPGRSAATPENARLRHLLYGRKPHSYRIIYRVLEKEKQVNVLHIRHGARQRFKSPGIE